MSRTPASSSISVVRGSTWEEDFDYYEDDGETPIDLTGYEARLQVRTVAGKYGTTTTTTLLFEATNADFLEIIAISPSVIPNRIRLRVDPTSHADINPLNAKKIIYAYGLEVFIPAGVDPEYVLPIAEGKLIARGEVVR